MSDIKKLTEKIIKFRDERDWKQFHNPKDVALSLVLETAEVVEHFQWKNQAEIENYLESNKDDVGEELADVLYWILLMCNDLEIDIKEMLERKIKKNAEKYPIAKSRGKHIKYNKL